MLATLIIVFREVIEAGLIIGVVLAAMRGVPRRGVWVSYGVLGGVAGACLVAVFAGVISAAMDGAGQEMFNAGILTIAVLMLTWHNVWMARHGWEMANHMKAVGEAVVRGQRSLMALSIVVGVAVLREGSEIVLFLYGIAVSGNDSAATMAAGGALGLSLGVALGAVTYLGLLRIPNDYLFAVTSGLIALLAAGMAAQAVAFLQQVQMITAFGDVLWNSSGLIAEGSIAGKALHTLIGYTDRPTAMQLMVYLATLLMIVALMRLFGSVPDREKMHAPAVS